MERKPLRIVRLRKGWTLEEAAEQLGVGRNTICRWERGLTHPHPTNIVRICQVYGLTAAELELDGSRANAPIALPPPPQVPRKPASQPREAAMQALGELIEQDLGLRLQCLLYDWLAHRKPGWSLSVLQGRLHREIESYDDMNQQDHPNHPLDEGRRQTLRRLALLPLHLLGLGVLVEEAKRSWPAEEIMTHCAAGITACQHLAKGQHEDIVLASSALTAYLPALRKIVKETSLHRQQAARLAGQSLLLKATLAVHSEGPQPAADYAQQALSYAETAEDLPLQLVILQRLTWIASCGRQPGLALNAAFQIQSLLEHPTMSVPSLILSIAYAGTARGLAVNHRQQETMAALSRMKDAFTGARVDDENFIYAEYVNPTYYDGKTLYTLGHFDGAFVALSEVVDPQTQMLKLSVDSERSRIDTINHMTLAALKRPNKDKELIVPLWMAGMQGAKNLRSEQRYEEALTAYGIMEALWSDDAQIRDLRDLMGHW
jgi:transcriptional regulator with XRE-family HTH domain